MDVRVVTRVTINASQQDVFSYLSDLQCHYIWNPHIRQINPVMRLRKGAVYQSEILILGVHVVNTNKVTKFVKDKEIELLNNKGQVQYRINYSLRPLRGKTQLVCTTVVTAVSSYFAFAKPVLRAVAQREIQADLESLKKAVESNLV